MPDNERGPSHERRTHEVRNVATLPWCLKNWQEGYSILIVEHEAKDIAAIPSYSDGKYRLHRCKVIGVKKLDYDAIFPKYEPPKRETALKGGGRE